MTKRTKSERVNLSTKPRSHSDRTAVTRGFVSLNYYTETNQIIFRVSIVKLTKTRVTIHTDCIFRRRSDYLIAERVIVLLLIQFEVNYLIVFILIFFSRCVREKL